MPAVDQLSAPPLIVVLDREDPMPLYGQIARAIRWRIGTGMLSPGDRLPGVREAADSWGVSLHTVRRAYGRLVEAGFLESRPGAGTTVLSFASAGGCAAEPSELDRWLGDVLREARVRFGASSTTLLDRLAAVVRPGLTVLECNAHQCRDLARQLAASLNGSVAIWPLDRLGAPPAGMLIGTRFHAAEMRERWPEREKQMRFVSLRIASDFASLLRDRLRATGARRTELWELDLATGRQMADDLRRIVTEFPEPSVLVPAARQLESIPREDTLVLVAPRLWEQLGSAVRDSGRTLEVRHVIPEEELDALARELGHAELAR